MSTNASNKSNKRRRPNVDRRRSDSSIARSTTASQASAADTPTSTRLASRWAAASRDPRGRSKPREWSRRKPLWQAWSHQKEILQLHCKQQPLQRPLPQTSSTAARDTANKAAADSPMVFDEKVENVEEIQLLIITGLNH
jgi:hypothetical protein